MRSKSSLFGKFRRNFGQISAIIVSAKVIFQNFLIKSNEGCHGWGSYSPASHFWGPGLYPGHSMWDLWWTKWYWDRFFSEFFGFPLLMSFHCCSPFLFFSWGMSNRPVGSCSSETLSHPININNNKINEDVVSSNILSRFFENYKIHLHLVVLDLLLKH
jgi:hypothetical protein